MWSYSQTSAQDFGAVQNVFAKYKASVDGKYWFSINGHNSIMSDCKTVSFCIYKDRRQTKMTISLIINVYDLCNGNPDS